MGEFRIHAALKQLGITLSPRTRGRIRALNRKLSGLGRPKRASHVAKPMPFEATRRHPYWTVDLRYLDMPNLGGGMQQFGDGSVMPGRLRPRSVDVRVCRIRSGMSRDVLMEAQRVPDAKQLELV